MADSGVSPAEEFRPRLPFPVVGVGASAGGLQSLEVLLRNLPGDTGAAFVVVTHMDPDHESLLPEILARFTSMVVRPAAHGQPLLPNTVSVAAPGQVLTLQAGLQHLGEVSPAERHTPIDVFLASLARCQGPRAFGVILSGTGSDGTQGLRDIGVAGGIAMVQDPATAVHPGMPQSALDAGVVDLALPLEELARRLAQQLRLSGSLPPALPGFDDAPAAPAGSAEGTPSVAQENGQDAEAEGGLPGTPGPARENELLQKLFDLLRAEGGHDFAAYKLNTVARRIHKRMLLAGLSSLAQYVALLESTQQERQDLARDLLIGVTRFFRDPEAFAALRSTVLPDIFKGKNSGDMVRVWVAGCSSGEEAYTMAILVSEYMEAAHKRCSVKILATDIGRQSVEQARRGGYGVATVADLAPDLLAKYFTFNGVEYQVVPELRDMIVFAQHDILRDPPFFRLDLVVCRNLLIYLTAEAQRKVLSLFFYALSSGGYLFLGPSETLGPQSGLFAVQDRKWRIYRKLQTGGRLVRFPVPQNRQLPQDPLVPPLFERRAARVDMSQVLERHLARRLGTAAVLVDADMNVLCFHGDLQPYMHLPHGEPSSSLYKLARGELRLQLRSAIKQVAEGGAGLELPGLHLPDGTFDLLVDPLDKGSGLSGLLVVIFRRVAACDGQRPAAELPGESEVVAQLEDELRLTREHLQEAVDGFDSVNEELKSSNEELMSMNEELQSSYEELETSREELQALNEELSIVNSELQQKVEELGETNSYLENLLKSTHVATIFLDRELRIQRFTPAASELFHLIETDVRRPITDITSRVPDLRVDEDALAVLANGQCQQREVRTTEGRWFQARTLPYLTPRQDVDGVVLTFVDITGIKTAQEGLRRANERLESRVEERTRELRERETLFRAIFEQAGAGIAQLAPEGTFLQINEKFRQISGYGTEELRSLTFHDMVHPEDRDKDLRHLAQLLDGDGPSLPVELRCLRKDGTTAWISLARSVVFKADGTPDYRIAVVQDITDRKLAEERAESQAKFPEQNPNPVLRFDSDGQLLYSNEAAAAMRAGCGLFGNSTCQGCCAGLVREAWTTGRLLRREALLGDKTFLLIAVPIVDKGYVNVYGTDVSDLKQTQTQLLQARDEAEAQREEYRLLLDNLPQITVGRLDAEGRYLYMSPSVRYATRVAAEDFVGRRPYEVGLPERLVALIQQSVAQVTSEGKEVSFQFSVPTPGGELCRQFRMAPAVVADGTVRSVIVVSYDITEIKKLEAGLRQARDDAQHRAAELQAVFDNMTEGLVTATPDGHLAHNPAVLELLGFADSKEAFATLERYPDLFELFEPDGTPMPYERWPLPRALAGETVTGQIITVRRTDTGKGYTANHNAVPVYGPDGRVVLAVLTVTDITAKMETERRLRLALDAVSAGVWEWDLRTGANIWSEELWDLYGLDRQVAPSYDAWLAHIHPDDREAAARAVNEAAAKGTDLLAEWRVDGTQEARWVMAVGQPVRGAGGRVERYVGIAMDITPRRRLETRLRQREEQLRLFVEHAPAAIAMFDTGMRYLAVSNRWLTDYGLEGWDLLGRSHYEVFPEVPERWRVIHRNALAGQVERAENDPFERMDGQTQWLRWEVRPWYEAPGRVGGILIFTEDVTARKAAEDALRQSQETLQAALSSMTDAVYIVDAQGHFLHVNKAFATFYRFGSVEECFKTFAEYPAIQDVFLENGEPAPVEQWVTPRALRGEMVSGAEYTLRRKDTGETWTGSFSFSPIRDDAGGIAGAVVVARDVTERKLATMEREATLKFLSMANENLGMADLARAATGFFQQLSGCEAVGIRLEDGGDFPYQDVRGFSPQFVQQVSPLCIRDAAGSPVLDDAGRPVLECLCGAVIRGTLDRSKSFCTARGSFWTNKLSALPVGGLGVPGAAVHFRGNCVEAGYESVALVALRLGQECFGLLQLNDRREGRFTVEIIALWERLADHLSVAIGRVRARDELARREAFFRSLFDNMLNGLAHCEIVLEDGRPVDFVYRDVNPAFVNLTGLRNVVGRRVSEIIPNIRNTDAGLIEKYGKVATSGVPRRFEYHLRAMDMWFSVSAFSPSPNHFVAVFDVITDQKQLIERLRKAKRDAEAANMAKGEFLANMSHEIRTPMNGVLGLIELALMNAATQEVREYLQMAKHSARHLMEILGDILDFSRISSGRIDLDLQPFSLHQLLDTALQPMAVTARQKGLSFDTDLPPDLPDRLQGDQLRLRQVLINIVSNAIKFTEQGGITVSIKVRPQGKACQLYFAVRDTGIGISPAEQERIFEKFTHIQSEAHVRHGGTGLGLAIAKSLVEKMGGSIGLHSAPGEGSEFFFHVLLQRAVQLPAGADGPQPQEDVGRLDILLADDDAVNSTLTSIFLQKRGHRVTAVANGREVLKALAAQAYDVVLMDVRMPVMDGEQATRIIRRTPPPGVDPSTPIIALTAHALKQDKERFLSVGMNDYITKPVDLVELERLVAVAVLAARAGKGNRRSQTDDAPKDETS